MVLPSSQLCIYELFDDTLVLVDDDCAAVAVANAPVRCRWLCRVLILVELDGVAGRIVVGRRIVTGRTAVAGAEAGAVTTAEGSAAAGEGVVAVEGR